MPPATNRKLRAINLRNAPQERRLAAVSGVVTETAENRAIEARLERQLDRTLAPRADGGVDALGRIGRTNGSRSGIPQVAGTERFDHAGVTFFPPRDPASGTAGRNGHSRAATRGDRPGAVLERVSAVDADVLRLAGAAVNKLRLQTRHQPRR
jgi:hypothetical protein